MNTGISFGNTKYRTYILIICQEISLAYILNILAYHRKEENTKELIDKAEVVINNLAVLIILIKIE